MHDLILRNHVPLKVEHLADDLLIIPGQSLEMIVHTVLHGFHRVELSLHGLQVRAVVVGAVHDRTVLNLLRLTVTLWDSLGGGRLSLDVVECVSVVDIELWVFELPGALPVWVPLQRLVGLPHLVKIISTNRISTCPHYDDETRISLVQLADEGGEIRVFEVARQDHFCELVCLSTVSGRKFPSTRRVCVRPRPRTSHLEVPIVLCDRTRALPASGRAS